MRSIRSVMEKSDSVRLKRCNDTAAVRNAEQPVRIFFQIGADRVCRQVFLIHIGELQIEAAVGVAGMPAERIEEPG